jgi:magnesium transporter
VNQLTLQEAAAVVSHAAVPRAAEVCDQPTLQRRSAILEQIEPGRAGQILEGSRPTSAPRSCADGRASRRRLLPKLSAECAPRSSAAAVPAAHRGRHHDHRVRAPRAGMTVARPEAHPLGRAREGVDLRLLRAASRQRRLLGAVSLRDLVMAELDRPVTEVMRKRPVTVSVLDDQEAVAAKIAKYNLLAVPVLEADGRVVGFVTVDDVIDVLISEGTEDVLRMAAIETDARDPPYVSTPFWSLIRKRAGWLMVLFVSEMLTATAMAASRRRSRARWCWRCSSLSSSPRAATPARRRPR